MVLLYSVATGEGKHWFAVLRTSTHVIEIFDSMGTSIDYIKKHMPFDAVYEFNSFPVQCNDSYYCGSFVVYFLVERYFNLDLEFEELLNDIFSPDCKKNEKTVTEFLKDIKK